MGKFIGVFACLVIVALDIIAGILGIRAEAAQNQVNKSTFIKKLYICLHNTFF